MDPLSIIASVIAVLQLTNTLVSICLNHRSKAEKASRIIRIMEELTSLRSVLERLVEVAENADESGPSHLPALKALCKPDGPLVKCEAELLTLEKKLKPASRISPVNVLVW